MGWFVQSASWATSGMILLALVGCDAPSMLTPAVAPVVLSAPETHYAAQPDHGFTVPAVQVAKVDPEMLRQQVPYPTNQPPGTIIIDPSSKHLYLVTENNQALRYGISVGRSGFGWSGEADITGRTNWPSWTPPPEMIARRPELAKFAKGEPGGLANPLGARALYLKTDGRDYGYRIHGTPEWNSIGHNASSGCIRMINQDVMDLYDRVPDGTHVIVLTDDGNFPTKLSVPPPARAKPKRVVVKPVDVPVSPPVIPSGRV